MALARLQKEPFGKVIIDWLKASREEQRDVNEDLNGNDLYRGQGSSQTLTAILREISEAPEAIASMQDV